MKRSTLLSAAALAVAFSIAPAAAQPYFGDLDRSADGAISEAEFSNGIGDTSRFGTYDADGDGMLTEDEFNRGLFNQYDANADGSWDESEFGAYGDDGWLQ